ncbi:HAD family hydrolase [Halomarina halobia]|uniref:HAD family hydrolase n=1 Tax=Halomarina halobia TaxID=3033386 RepID=A0ABD6A691_9EURY|nr:HAD hydrolase-like protein [Halomarina sp. PSR21]
MGDPIEAILFDLDDTLCTYRRSGQEILSLAFEAIGREPFFTAEGYYEIFDDFVTDSDSGLENRQRCFAALAERAGYSPSVGREVADAYAEERDQTNVRWLPGAKEALDVHSPDYSLALITNGPPEWQIQKIDALGIADRFETIVYAGYDTAPKPDPEPFHIALDRLNTEPERAVTVGNSLGSDVAGAHSAGVRSIWLDADGIDDPEPAPHHRIETMSDLTDDSRSLFTIAER